MVGMVGHGHPFGDLEVGKAAVDLGKGIANQGEKHPPGGVATADGDEDFFVFGVGFDPGHVVDFVALAVGQHDAAAPAGLVIDFFVAEHDEARQHALGQDAVLILKLQGVTLQARRFGLIFGQQAGDEEFGSTAVGQGKAELKLLHQLGEVAVAIDRDSAAG
jgi:hypothetical protein